MEEIYKAIVELLKEGEVAALATIVRTRGSTPRGVGAKILISKEGRKVGSIGGGALEAEIIREAQEALKEGKPRLLHYGLRADKHEGDFGVCGGDMDVFIEVIEPKPTLLIIGAGHVAVPLAELGSFLGFRTLVLDDRPDFANRERFPKAEEVIVGEIPAELGRMKITPQTYIVIATREHKMDAEALKAVLGRDCAYIGLLGSRRKVGFIFQSLRSEGMEEALGRVHAPIGLEIGAEMPEEIAISIAAEIVLVRKGGSGKPLKSARVIS
jgi:xanthine dehydrogenase accessory factor